MFFFSSRRRHTRLQGDWSSDVCSSDLTFGLLGLVWSEARERFDDHEVALVEGIADQIGKIGRASCRERVEVGVVAGAVEEQDEGRGWDDRREGGDELAQQCVCQAARWR